MATFTIVGSQNIDALAGKTGGDVYNINGGILTIDQDSRSGLNQSTSTSLGSVTVSSTLGGKIIIDTSLVREIPFDSGSGVVPAFNTTISQGGASGLLIAVYATLSSGPIASGGAMPATGYIKIKQWNSVVFTSGTLTGITANATGPDVQGWIELVADQVTTMTSVRLGAFECNKDNPYLRYEIGTTDGTIGQTLQTPTFGGTNSYVPAIWIEDGVGGYESWNGIYSTNFSTTNFGTDIRSKVFHALPNGEIRFGSDGTSNVGYVPPTGRKVYIPTVILRQTSAANRTLNLLPATTATSRPEFATTGGGVINMNSIMGDWYFNFVSAYSVSMRNFSYFDTMVVQNVGSKPDCRDGCSGVTINPAAAVYGLFDTLNSFGTYFENINITRGGTLSNTYGIYVAGSINPEYKNIKVGHIAYARGTGYCFIASQCTGLIIDGIQTINRGLGLSACSGSIRISGHDHNDRYVGTTNATTSIYAFTTATSTDDVIYENFSFGHYGAIADVHPYNGPYNANYSSNIIVRNGGTALSPLNGGSANQCAYLYGDSGNNTNIKIQRVYLSATRSAPILPSNTSKGLFIENCIAGAGVLSLSESVSYMKGFRVASITVSGQAACYGTHRYNTFTNDTVGVVTVAMNEATPDTTSQIEIVSLGATSGFTSVGQLSIPETGEAVIRTTPYYIKGYTAFTNTALTITGTSTTGITYEYQIDLNDGNGFNGTWKTADGPTLSGETINEIDGFKLKVRITTTTTVSGRALLYMRINMTTTATAQTELYPLTVSNRTYTLTGLEIGSEIVMFDASNNELDREVVAGTTYSYNYERNSDDGDSTGYVLIRRDDKQPIKLAVNYIDANTSVPIAQVDDLVYNGAYTSVSTIDYANKLQILTTQTVSVPFLYSERKDDILVSNNSQYDFAYEIVGGNVVVGATSIPDYVFQTNGRKIRPMEANGTTNMTDGIIVAESGDPFVNTLGAYTVRINFQNPVQAITVSTSGGTLTAVQVREEMDSNSTKLIAIKQNTDLIPATL